MDKTLKKRAVISAAAGVVLIAAGITVMNIKKPVQRFNETFFAMDCPCEITVYAGDDLTKDIKDRINGLDHLLSAYDEESDINRLNAAESGERVSISRDSSEVLRKSLGLYEKYGGCNILIGAVTKLWDISGEPKVPSDEEIETALATFKADEPKNILNIADDGKSAKLLNSAQADLGCIAKGYALDKVKEILDEQKPQAAIASFGSSIYCCGKKPDGSPFKIGIRDPFMPDGICAQIETDGCFLSTSGGYERFFSADGVTYCHIFDEATGRPTRSTLQSVTVIADSGAESDFLSTRIFVGGEEELERWLSDDEISVIAIDDRGRLHCSENIKESVSITNSEFTFAD
ncbi:MAG: FAD:protein FMN transferase [Ruminococcus sp.]|nr:FAD:protein FMN transferase [Ruminococcus sp.]